MILGQNWKTTSTGIGGVVIVIADTALKLISGTPVDFNIVITSLITSIGLIMAGDAKRSGNEFVDPMNRITNKSGGAGV